MTPLLVVCGSSLPSSTILFLVNVVKVRPPLTKLSGSAHSTEGPYTTPVKSQVAIWFLGKMALSRHNWTQRVEREVHMALCEICWLNKQEGPGSFTLVPAHEYLMYWPVAKEIWYDLKDISIFISGSHVVQPSWTFWSIYEKGNMRAISVKLFWFWTCRTTAESRAKISKMHLSLPVA